MLNVWSLCGELTMWINGISMLKELLAMFCLMDDKKVIHIPEPKPGWMGEVLMVLHSNSFMNNLTAKGLTGEPIAVPLTCS